MSIPTISITGKAGAGKTSLIEKLLAELKSRHYKVATVKHHAHAGFDIDMPGKDSWRFAQAGSDHVIIAAPDMIASYAKLDHEMSIENIISMVSGVDLILTEGYRAARLPTIEIVRSQVYTELLSLPEQLIAISSDRKFDIQTPQFSLDNVKGIVDLIISKYLTQGMNSQ